MTKTKTGTFAGLFILNIGFPKQKHQKLKGDVS